MTENILEDLRDARIGEYRTVHYRISHYNCDMNVMISKSYWVSGVVIYAGLDTVCIQEDSGHHRYILTSYIQKIV